MEPNPYEAPAEGNIRRIPRRNLFLGVPWFWLALLLLVIAVMVVNQIGGMHAVNRSGSGTPTTTP